MLSICLTILSLINENNTSKMRGSIALEYSIKHPNGCSLTISQVLLSPYAKCQSLMMNTYQNAR